MPLARNERTDRLRSIRTHLLNAQERRGPASTPTGAKQEVSAAVAELVIFVKMEYPEGDSPPAGDGDP